MWSFAKRGNSQLDGKHCKTIYNDNYDSTKRKDGDDLSKFFALGDFITMSH